MAPGFDLGYTIGMRRWVPPLVAALAIGAGACGGDDGARLALHTPPEHAGAEPLPEVRAAEERAEAALQEAKAHRTKADARRARPVLAGWARALRRDGGDKAAAFFAVPAIVAQGVAVRLETEADVMRFHVSLPCGVRLVEFGRRGRFFIATFRMTARPGHVCSTVGDRVKVAVVVQRRKITEWRQIPDTPGAAPGPAQPEDAPPPPPKRVS